MAAAGAALRCEVGHSFDVARQGYVNLLGHAAPRNADTPAMLAARDRFLARGFFDPLRDALTEAVADARVIVEVGAGTGFYLSGVLAEHPDARGVALDVSAAAARACARAGLPAIVADTWQALPLAASAFDVVLCVFAPRNPAEFARLLAPGGRVLVAAPLPGHLASLRAGLGLLEVPDDKAERLRDSFAAAGLHLTRTRRVRAQEMASAEALADLVAMGPNAFHSPAAPTQSGLVELDVAISEFEPA